MNITNKRLWDKRYDGHRFCFYVQKYDTGKTTMKDTMGEFDDIELPNDFAEFLSQMLMDLHNLQKDKLTVLGNLKSLIMIAEESNLDKDILMTCIKYGMDYKKEVM